MCRAVLYLVGYLAASLASTHWVPAHSPIPTLHMTTQNVSRHCQRSPEKQNRLPSSTENHCSHLSTLMAGFNGSRVCTGVKQAGCPQLQALPSSLALLFHTSLLSGQNPRSLTSLCPHLQAFLPSLSPCSLLYVCLLPSHPLSDCPPAQAPSVFCPLVFLVSLVSLTLSLLVSGPLFVSL